MDSSAENRTRFEAVCRQLTTDELRYLTHRVQCDTNREAARRAELSESTVYAFPHKELVDKAVRLYALDGLVVVSEMMRRAAIKAAEVKIDGLVERDHRLRQDVASEILDRAGLGVEQKIDVTSKGEQIGGDATGLTDERQVAALMALYERVRARVLSQSADEESPVDAAAGSAN